MGLTGAIGTAYVLAVGGDLNGPTLGAIFTIVGFSAFGKHPKNIVPIMAGVFLASILKDWSADDPSVVLAALFGTTLAPIAGRFGWRWGMVAGFVHWLGGAERGPGARRAGALQQRLRRRAGGVGAGAGDPGAAAARPRPSFEGIGARGAWVQLHATMDSWSRQPAVAEDGVVHCRVFRVR